MAHLTAWGTCRLGVAWAWDAEASAVRAERGALVYLLAWDGEAWQWWRTAGPGSSAWAGAGRHRGSSPTFLEAARAVRGALLGRKPADSLGLGQESAP